MINPIHHSIISSERTQHSKLLDLVLFVVFTISYVFSLLTNSFKLFSMLIIALVLYELYVVTAHPTKTILSFKTVSTDDLRSVFRYVAIGSIISIIYIVILQAVTYSTNLEIVIHEGLQSVSFTAMTVIAFALIPSVAEEIIFRHFLQGRILSRFSKLFRITIPTLVFAYAHVLVYSESLSGFLSVTALLPTSFVLAIIYEETESIIPSIILHFLFNLIAVLLFATFSDIV